VNALVNASDQMVNHYRYTPFGERVASQTTEGTENPLQYMARELDAVTGLYYVRNRWYDPQMGRFISEDPIGLAGGMNLYEYAASNPVSFTDPFGLIPCAWHVVTVSFPAGERLFMLILSEGCLTQGGLWEGVSDPFAGWASAFSMYFKWAVGSGPEHRHSVGGMHGRQLQNSIGVQQAREGYCRKNAHIRSASEAAAWTDGGYNFVRYQHPFRSVARFWNAGLIGTRQFVGSYDLEVHPTPGYGMRFRVTNTTSFESLLLGIGPEWDRSTFAPMGNVTQSFEWTENFTESCGD
jgi:RHS repeat-associated protein